MCNVCNNEMILLLLMCNINKCVKILLMIIIIICK